MGKTANSLVWPLVTEPYVEAHYSGPSDNMTQILHATIMCSAANPKNYHTTIYCNIQYPLTRTQTDNMQSKTDRGICQSGCSPPAIENPS